MDWRAQVDEIRQAVICATERLLGASSWREALPEVLERLGRALHATRVGLFEAAGSPDGNGSASPVYEWVAPDGAARDGDPLAVPVFVGTDRWGDIVFENVRLAGDDLQAALSALRIIAGIVGAAVAREQAEAAAHNAEERFVALFRNFPLPALVWQRHGDDFILVDFNIAAFDITCGGIDQLRGALLSEAYHDVPELMEDIAHAFAEQTVTRREMSYRFRTTGEQRYMEFTCSFAPPDLVIMHAQDLTERRQTLGQLHLFESAVFSANEPLVILQGLSALGAGMPRVLYVNEAFSRLTGYRAEEAVGRSVDFLGGARTDTEAMVEVHNTLASGQPFQGEFVLCRKDGSEFWAEVSLLPVAVEALPGTYWVALLRDITARKQAEEALRESENRYRILSELASDFAFAFQVTPDGRLELEWITDAFSRITGFTPQEMEREGWSQIVHPGDLEMIFGGLDGLAPDRLPVYEVRIAAKTGEIRWLRIRVRPMWDDEEGRVVRLYGVGQDVTDRRLMEMSLLRSERLAAMGRLAAALAHEINNPLQAVQSSLELALDFPLPSAEREQYLQAARREIEHLTTIASRVLDFARPPKAERRPLQVVEAVDLALALANKQIQHAHIRVERCIPDGLPSVMASRDHLVQVFLNLIINAIEVMPEGGGLRISAQTRGEWVELVFADSGPGIAEDILPVLFEPFRTTKAGGVGLGLAVSRGIVQEHGGNITAHNSLEGGAVFVVSLPAATSRF